MTPEQLKQIRRQLKLTQEELGRLIGEALYEGRPLVGTTIGRYEMGKREIPLEVETFLLELVRSRGEDPPAPQPAEGQAAEGAGAAADTPPPPQEPPQPATSAPVGLTGGGAYAKVCTELWETIGVGVGLVGATTGSAALVGDAQIIDRNKRDLGAAWGKLAETNETFRRMLVGLTTSSAWLEVAMVTGKTVGEMYWHHQAVKAQQVASGNGHVPAEPQPAS